MKNKLMLLSMLFLCSAATVSAQFVDQTRGDPSKILQGKTVEAKLNQMRTMVPGGGFIDPEKKLSDPDREALSYYRQWKAQQPSMVR